MYSDGDRKTLSELQRVAATLRNNITEENTQLERTRKAVARMQDTIDQMFSVFARETEKEGRNAFMSVLNSISEDVVLTDVPLLPIVIALANGHLSDCRRLYAVRNRYVDDGSIIFLAHVLRFVPATTEIELLDISETKVSEKALCFLLEMMLERETRFVLIAKDRIPLDLPVAETCMQQFNKLLQKVQAKENCTVTL
ncbi:uncharacterized protein TM35_000024970 [Trypanosoma theileri]|uniref:Uncharacterized protein n=1 Tax=Trypanosoma theileri TaxID=67003 RepID=A0A1X0P8L2_9TRYP|nr:uncharacterized protein TM35_000024970 [Trypanosoma theileri]ORC93171.1 hypothetical protein TM35_000024970 [Trypanosoma theileri]